MESKIKFEVGRVYECRSLLNPENLIRFEVTARTKVRVTLREVDSGREINRLGLERTVPHIAEQCYPFGVRVGRPVLSAANVVEEMEKEVEQ